MQAYVVRLLNAVGAANGVPSAATDGYAPTEDRRVVNCVGFEGQFSRTSGTATFRLRLWGYTPQKYDTSDAVISSSGFWSCLYDTGAAVLTYTTDFNEAFCVEHAGRYTRFYLELVSISGTGAVVTAGLSFVEGD